VQAAFSESKSENSNSLYHYSYDLESMKNLITPLSVPWHKEKGLDFTDVFIYVGFSWNIPEKSVSLPGSKYLKYLTKIQSFLQSYEHTYIYVHHLNDLFFLSDFKRVIYYYIRKSQWLPYILVSLDPNDMCLGALKSEKNAVQMQYINIYNGKQISITVISGSHNDYLISRSVLIQMTCT